MSYDEEEQRKSRIVVETPTTRREVVQQQTTRIPEERRGVSTGVVAAVALTAVALTALLFMYLSNKGDATNTNVNLAIQPTPLQATQPTPLPPVAQQPTPYVYTPPPTTTLPSTTVNMPPITNTTTPTATPVDSIALQDRIRQRILEDRELSAADISVDVVGTKATLTGTVNTQSLKDRARRFASIPGVRSVDNKIIVTGDMNNSTPSSTPAIQ
ncbi:MAG: BON domain-containing protein [Pyrinomonadaceae bacterium]|nr:BON domain-containing protein [Pyrinomonadaceae bacterium]